MTPATIMPLAHSGHWLLNVLYLVPLIIIVAMLGWQKLKDKRREPRPEP
jgi:hypothetical protein